MHLFIEHSIFYNIWPNFGPRFWDIFSISGNALINHFSSIVISWEKRKTVLWGFGDSMHLFIKDSKNCYFWAWAQIFRYFLDFGICAYESLLWHRNIFRKSEKRFCEVLRIRCNFSLKIQFFYNFWPNFGPGFWDIFSISGNALMNHFFSIVISWETRKTVLWGFGIRCTFSLKIQKIVIFDLGPRFSDIFWISGNALMNHFYGIAISFEKPKNGSVRFCWSDATFHWRFNFFTIFGLILGPDFEIFSQFQEMRLWITSLAS